MYSKQGTKMFFRLVPQVFLLVLKYNFILIVWSPPEFDLCTCDKQLAIDILQSKVPVMIFFLHPLFLKYLKTVSTISFKRCTYILACLKILGKFD